MIKPLELNRSALETPPATSLPHHCVALVIDGALLNNTSSVRCVVLTLHTDRNPCRRKEAADDRVTPTDVRRPATAELFPAHDRGLSPLCGPVCPALSDVPRAAWF